MIVTAILLLLSFTAWAETTDIERALCGEKPSTEKQQQEHLEKGKWLEHHMPPVSDQHSTSWCYAFVATDALNYQNYLNEYQSSKISPEDFYQAHKMISPIDSAAAYAHFMQSIAEDDYNPSGDLNLERSGGPLMLYQAFRHLNFKARSLEQIEFNSLNEDNEFARQVITDLIEEYEKRDTQEEGNKYYYNVAGLRCPAPLVETDYFQHHVKSFKTINNWLFQEAQSRGLLSSNTIISNYQELAALKGEKDINIAPYSVNQYRGNDKIKFLSEIKKRLSPKDGSPLPVKSCVCGEELKEKSKAGCTPHAIHLVGAYYAGVKCVMRIRNTWGSDWMDAGHTNIPVQLFLDFQESCSQLRNKSHSTYKYAIDWIAPLAPGQSKSSYTRVFDSKTSYTEIKDVTYTKNQKYKWRFSSTLKQDNTGNYFWAYHGVLKNGNTFTGDITGRDGQWRPLDGMECDSQGLAIFYYKEGKRFPYRWKTKRSRKEACKR